MQSFIISELDNYTAKMHLTTLGICCQELQLGDFNLLLQILYHMLLLIYSSHTHNYKCISTTRFFYLIPSCNKPLYL